MMILLFTALNAFLESFFFRRADPVWLFFVFGILGLRMVGAVPDRGPGALTSLPVAPRSGYGRGDHLSRHAQGNAMTIKAVLAGCGNMGYAMAAGWLKSGSLAAIGTARGRAERRICARAPRRSARKSVADADDIAAGRGAAARRACRQAAGDPRGDGGLSPLCGRRRRLSSASRRGPASRPSRRFSAPTRRSSAACPTRRLPSARA